MKQPLHSPARSVSEGSPRLRFGLVILVVATAAPAPASAQEQPIKLTLSPAAAPVPALKYLLLPELKDQTPGNAALEYYRAFSPEWWGRIRQPKMWEKIDDARQMPLKDLPRKELSWLDTDPMLRQVDNAARREYVDWGMTERLRRQGFGVLMPDIQSLRQIGTLLAVRARLEIAEGRYDRALYTLQTGMALAHHTGEGVTLIQDLVGIALAQMMLARLEELIQQPGAPNLYWALTDLPRPFVDLRKALQGEKLALYAELPDLRTLETTRLTPEMQQKWLQILGGGLDALHPRRNLNWDRRLLGTFLVLRGYPEAKKALIAEGRKPEEVEALPTLQVVLIHALHQYQQIQDDLFKWYGLPYWEARPQLERSVRQLRTPRLRLEAFPFFEALPAIQNVISATVRLERRIAALRCVGAIRLYAAGHDGKLPETLDAITEVLLPIDPVTGKAFAYRVSGDRATLSAPPPQVEQANPNNSLHYELTIRRTK